MTMTIRVYQREADGSEREIVPEKTVTGDSPDPSGSRFPLCLCPDCCAKR